MDLKTKILFTVFLGLIFGAALLSYQRYFVRGEYLITAEVPCDPATEVCFVSHCNPVDDEECTDAEPSYYKKIEGTAHLLPSCDPNDAACALAQCGAGMSSCQSIPCGADAECATPELFQAEPIEAEANALDKLEGTE